MGRELWMKVMKSHRVSNHVAHGVDVVAVPITLTVTYG